MVVASATLLMSDPRRTPFDDLDDHAVLKTAEIAARLGGVRTPSW